MLETTRLSLRPMQESDAEGFFALNSDPEVLQYTGDVPFRDVEEARAFLRAYDQFARYRMGRFSVFLRETGAYLGWCGLKYHPDTGETDLGFRFFRAHWGKGYATEAATVCLEYGFHTLGLRRIIGRAMAGNAASIRVLEKVGMRLERHFEADGKRWVQYEKKAT